MRLMESKVSLAIALFLMMLLWSSCAISEILKCIDSQGKVSYSNTSCPSDTKIEKNIGGTSSISVLPNKNQPFYSENNNSKVLHSNSTNINANNYPYTEIYRNKGFVGFGESEREQDIREATAHVKEEMEEKVREATEQAEEIAEQLREEADEKNRKAIEEAEAADDVRNQIRRSSVKNKNSIYFNAILFTTILFSVYLIKQNRKGKYMNENQKYGIVTMIVSCLLILLALMVSEGWSPQFDYIENLMNLLEIQRFDYKTVDPESRSIYNPSGHKYVYLIDISTKYVVLIFLSTAAYGLTTYLGITPAFTPWKKSTAK